MSRPTAETLEEIIDAIFGNNFGRPLTATENITVAAFKNLMAEYMSRKMVELRYDAQQYRKEAARLYEEVRVLEFVESWPVEHPRAQ